MKKIILFVLTMSNIYFCIAQHSKNIESKTFQILLSRFRDIEPPINYKKIMRPIASMTKEEAIQFLQIQEDDLSQIKEEYNYDTEGVSYIYEEYLPGCDFKYKLNDSIYILCIRESLHSDSTLVYLLSFTFNGREIDRWLVGEQFTLDGDWISFVLLDKNTARVYHYEDNEDQKGFHSASYYVEYQITESGTFIKKCKSSIMYLKNTAIKYSTYKLKSDDPMNEYDF